MAKNISVFFFFSLDEGSDFKFLNVDKNLSTEKSVNSHCRQGDQKLRITRVNSFERVRGKN